MAIPKGAKHPGNAEKFMNYILEPKVGAALTNFVSYGSPNKAAEPFINKDILDNPLIYPPADDAREAAVPEGHRRGRDQVLRPVDRGQDGLTRDRGRHATFRLAAGRSRSRNRNGGSCPTGSRAICCCSPTSVWFIFLLVIPTLLIVAYSLGQRGVIEPIRFSWGNLVWSNYTDRAESRLPADLHPLDRVRVGRRRSRACCSGSRSRIGSPGSAGRFRNVLPRARDHPVPHELPDPHVRVAVHPAAQRVAELGARARSGSATTTRSSTPTSR